MKKNIFTLSLLLLAFLALPKISLALGQMTEPIIIENALRGETIQQELIAVNSEKKEIEVKYIAEGDIKDWVNFYVPGDLDNQLNTFILPATGNLRVVAIVDVPDDIENGLYTGSFSVANIPSTDVVEGESGSNVTQKIDRQISINISDQEEINIANTSVIPNKFDLEVDEPLSIRVIYDNQGNIRLAPQARLKIKKDDKTVYDIIYPYPEEEKKVGANSQHEISPIVVQTIGWETGKYSANMEFSHNGETLLEKDFQFSINNASKNAGLFVGMNNNMLYGLALSIGIILLLTVWYLSKNKKYVN